MFSSYLNPMWPFRSTQPPDQSAEIPTRSLEASVEPSTPINDTKISDDNGISLAITGHSNERLSIPFAFRAPVLMTASFLCGLSLGAAHGGPKAAYRYRAENAHRLPTTQTGWFLYQKSKNYHATLGALKEGFKFGGVCTGWATLFMVTEEIIDQSRGRLFAKGDDEVKPGQRDAANTVIAAMSMAGLYSWRSRLDKFAAARTVKLALKYSLIYGLVQDIAASLRGNRPAYVDWIARKTFWPQIDYSS